MEIFWRILNSWVFRLCLALNVVLAGAFFLFLAPYVERSVVKELLEKEQIIVRAEAGNLSTFIIKLGNSVSFIAQLESVKNDDDRVSSYLDTFIEQRKDKGIVGGIVITDEEGIVRYHSTVSQIRDLGNSLSDRDFFIRVKTEAKEGEYFISQPVISRLGDSEGEMIVTVSSPVIQSGELKGVVAASVKLHPLADSFLKLMQVSEETGVYLIDNDGQLLYSSLDPESIGQSTREYFSNYPNLSNKIQESLNVNEGQIQTRNFLGAAHSFSVDGEKWLLIITAPASKVEELMRSFYIRLIGILILTTLTVIAFGIIAARRNLI